MLRQVSVADDSLLTRQASKNAFAVDFVEVVLLLGDSIKFCGTQFTGGTSVSREDTAMAERLVIKDAERNSAAIFRVKMFESRFVLSEYGPANIAQMTTTAMIILDVRLDVTQRLGDEFA